MGEQRKNWTTGLQEEHLRRVRKIAARARALLEDAEALEKELRYTPAEKPEGLASLREVQAMHVLRAVRTCGGNKSKAARILGINVKSVHNWLERIHESNYHGTRLPSDGARRLVV